MHMYTRVIKPGVRWPQVVRAWFLEIDPVRDVCVYVCVCVSAPKLLITSGVIWTTYDWLNKF